MAMDTQTALANVDRLVLGEDSILVKMRSRLGLDREGLDVLVESIEHLIDVYRDQDQVPKRLALAFVDISNYFYFSEQYYSESERDELEDAAQRISELANQLFDD